jgi:formylglycine-generating enzyme required for sulfatase activity
MSDELHDAVENSIRDNAGHMALAGVLMAHSQRKQQLQALEASRRHQAEIARTEAERLEVEKQRLKIEKLRHQIEKDEKEAARLEKDAVRLLRVMMAEVGLAVDSFISRGELKGSPQGARRNYVMAVVMSKLALVRSRSGSLSDLNDLKELTRLEELSEDLVDKQFPGGDPLETTRTKWSELQVWMDGVDRLEKQVKQACAVVPDPNAVQLPSHAELVAMQAKLEAFATQLASDLSEHVHRLPPGAVVDGVLLGELAEQAQLEDLGVGKQANRSKAFASRWRQAAITRIVKQPGMLVSHEIQPALSQEVQSAIEKLQQWQIKAVDHERTLQDLKVQLEEGRFKEAEVSAKKLGKMRFAGLNYQSVPEWEKLDGLCAALAVAKRGAASRLATDLRKKYPKAAIQSELGRLLCQHEKRASGEKTKALVLAALFIGLAAGFAKLSVVYHSEWLQAEAEARAKEESEKQAHKRMIENAKIKAEAAKAAFLTSFGNGVILVGANVEMTMTFISPGTFTMGSYANQVQATIIQPFWLAKTEVTQAQWETVMASNPSHWKGANLPVESVSWEDAQAFIDKLNDKQILPQGWKFALPTEAQWEYACRAGEIGPYSGGGLREVGWYDDNSYDGNSYDSSFGMKTHEVGKKKPNAWGLYDMHGNVEEWCADCYHDMLKGGVDPAGPSSGSKRVFRGGGSSSSAERCSASYRDSDDLAEESITLGFRIAIVPTK